MNADFFKSFASFEQLIADESVGVLPQIAFVGRSNVGKSSLLNMLTNRKGLAVTSQKPGRTRLINFFQINKELYFVDLPGYGFSSASKSTTDGWTSAITDYLTRSPHLRLVFVLLDIRHAPTQLDIAMLHFLQSNSIAFKILATKADKLSRSAALVHRQKLAQSLGLASTDIIVTSSTAKQGRQEVLTLVQNLTIL